jgi:polysaccharide deacetylase family protein (PEP-CTERM system associated)
VADRQPEIVREVARRGHEVASRGLYHRKSRPMTPAEFREDLSRSREAVEAASGTRVHGYRAARLWSSPAELWKLDVLAEEGYAYDSSLLPVARAFRAEPRRRFAHLQQCEGGREVWEFPVSTTSLLGWRVPIAGGNYFRQVPHTLLKHAVEHWHRAYEAPFVMYAHVWELDPEQPRISGASSLARLRHYRNLDKMRWVLEDYFGKYRFVGMADYLGLGRTPANALGPVERRRETIVVTTTTAPPRPVPVTVVVPCYNEEKALSYLANTLASVAASLADAYELRFLFVDDASRDDTYAALQRVFGAWPHASFMRHERNLGVAAAILNGARRAETEVVCSIDCDCTYDPHELRRMIPRLEAGVAMVTASPYHPQGKVRNVPGWRLLLSKAASLLYRRALRQELHTYTSCFRVYRRAALLDLRLREGGFLGVAETLALLVIKGERVVEHPATLEVRLFGHSKMKTLRTIAGHLRLLARLRSRQAPPPQPLDVRFDADAPLNLQQHTLHTTSAE